MGTTLHLPLLHHRYAIDFCPTTTRRPSNSLKTGFRTSSFVPLRRIHGPGTMLTTGLNQSKAGNKICPTLRTTGATRAAPATVSMAAPGQGITPFGPFPPKIVQNFNDGDNKAVKQIILYQTTDNKYIEGIQIQYDSKTCMHGARSSNKMEIDIASDDSITQMSGYYDEKAVVVRNLGFVKNSGSTYSFGPETGTHFPSTDTPCPSGKLVGFFGNASTVLQSIGADFQN